MEISEIIDDSLAQNVSEKLEQFSSAHSIPSAMVFAMDHALSEYLQNLVDHSDAQQSHVSIEYNGRVLKATVKDDGKPYNILTHQPVDLNIPFAERTVGGLGIHMITKLLDEIQYESSNGWNTAVLTKNRLGMP